MTPAVRFGYIVQLDLPGGPIKIGSTSQPRSRWATFDSATPVATRMVGLTLHGIVREREMLAATNSRIVKGEWRYPTLALQQLILEYYAMGEWFVPAADHLDHFTQTRVKERVIEADPTMARRTVCRQSAGWHWAQDILRLAKESDPLLGLDWNGFVPASQPPSFIWSESPRTDRSHDVGRAA
jgi:hypothetical protein